MIEFEKCVVGENEIGFMEFALGSYEYKIVLYALYKMNLENKNEVFIGVDKFKNKVLGKDSKTKGEKSLMLDSLEKLSEKSVCLSFYDKNIKHIIKLGSVS